MTCENAPIIGIVSRAFRLEARSRPFLGAFESYIEAVDACGGNPLILPFVPEPGALRICDGIVFTGGEDLTAPEWWLDSDPHGVTDQRRDAFETTVFLRCRDMRLPVLGLCRGAQLVNCLLGGTLTRSPPSRVHDHGVPQEIIHEVNFQHGSVVSAAYGGATDASVLSRHSTFIAELGQGLAPVAWASDGTVEAFEAQEWPCIGVLWHAEWAGREGAPDLALFRWLAEVARRRPR
jgi:putative glutamine amidotransferase